MGNITSIVPVKNKENFNKEFILNELRLNFEDLRFDDSDYSVTVFKKGVDSKEAHDFVMSIYFDQNCNFLDFERDLSSLKEILLEAKEAKRGIHVDNLIENMLDLVSLKRIGVDVSVETTYGLYPDEKHDVDFFLRDLFEGYIFDEGIHPEFIGPKYVRKEKPVYSFWRDFWILVKGLLCVR